jgi:hypothetical protein
MSRAFVKDDASEPDPRFDLPSPDSPYFPEASAWALIQAADAGDSRSAEQVTGFVWGDRRLVDHVRRILEEATSRGEDRTATLARRFLRAAGVSKEPGPDQAGD